MLKLLNIKQAIAFGYLCLIIGGCSYTPYRYSFSLVEPQNDIAGQAMSFEDENIQFKFIPSSENIRMSIKNKTDHEINLVRDNAEYIDSAGESRRIHYGQDYVQEVTDFSGDNNSYAKPMKIGTGTDITGYVWVNIWPDFCIGQGRNAIASYQIYNLLEPLFPRYSFEGRGEDLKGSTFSLVLPVDFGEYTRNYTFTFMINDVL